MSIAVMNEQAALKERVAALEELVRQLTAQQLESSRHTLKLKESRAQA